MRDIAARGPRTAATLANAERGHHVDARHIGDERHVGHAGYVGDAGG